MIDDILVENRGIPLNFTDYSGIFHDNIVD
jgi:hypothetical protein